MIDLLVLQVLDFGVASLLPRDTTQRVDYVMTGKVGSLRYMAPEVMLKDERCELMLFSYHLSSTAT